MSMYEIDMLQNYITSEEAYEKTKIIFDKYDIQEQYIKIFLVSELFYKFPDFYPNMSDDLKLQISNVYNQINLKENIELYNTLLKEWKKNDLSEMISQIDNMKGRTRSSSLETENENCKLCYKTQENILDIAQTFLENMDNN